MIYLIPTLIAAWIGWRWRRWWGVFIAVTALWVVLLFLGFLSLFLLEDKIRLILERA